MAATRRQQRGNSGLAGGAGRMYGGLLAPRSAARMEFRILGPLEALDGSRALPLGGGKQRALLAVFLLHANETLSTDRLIDELWGERPPATAAKTVQVYISRLRKTLAGGEGGGSAGAVVTREHGYELGLDPDRLDAHRFERLVAEGRGELAAGRPERAAAALERALSLWRGAPLADLAYEPFAQREIARLDDLRVAALEQLIEAKLALGAHAEVVGQLEALIGEHPYRERPRAQLMLALYRSERQADALQAYQDARRTLVEELGIEPGERLRELERAVLAQDPDLHLVAAEQPAAAEPAVETPGGAFVGRERELAELVGGLDDVFAGRGRLFLLAGEPGIGKSRLAEELVGQARGRGALVLVGRCWEAGGAPAYWPWVQSLRAYVRGAEPDALRAQLGAGAADLAQFLPELRERFPDLPELSSLEAEAARFRLFDATAEFLRRASESRPIVLVLDDLHAADAPSLLLLRFVARELGSTRMLLLGAYRDVDPLLGHPLTEMLVEVAREPVTRHLPLGGLSEGEVAEYVELTAPEIASRGLLAALDEETEGNPLFVGEIVRLLSAEGVRPESTDELRLAIPRSVRDVIARRLTHLSEERNQVLVLASVLGREFELATLARVAGVPEDGLLDVLDEAVAARVVSDVPGAPDRLRFAHVLIRDTLYEELATNRRLRLHREVGEALEALHGSNPKPHLAELAHHYLLAGATAAQKAIRYAAAAGDRAASQLGYEEAARHYRSAFRVLETTGARDEQRACDLLLSLADVLSRAGNSTQAKEAYRRAAAIAEQEDFTDKLARAALGYGGRFAWARAGSDPSLVPLLERALAAVGKEDSAARVRLLARLAAAIRDDPSRDRRVALAEEAVEIAKRSGDPLTLAYALEGYWLAVEGPDPGGEGIGVGDQLISLGEQVDDKERVFSGRDFRLGALWKLVDRTGINVELDSLARLADELRQPAQRWYVGTVRTMLALMEGRFEEAEQLISETLAVGQRAEGHAIVSQRLQLFVLRRAQGRLAELEETIGRSVHEYPALLRFRCALAHLHGQVGREREARTALDGLLSRDLGREHVDSEWLFTISLLADPCALLGHEDAAATLYSLLLPYKELYAQAPAEASFGSVARGLGVLATKLRRFDDAQMHFDAAVEKERIMGARPWLAHAQQDYAQMLLARAQPGDSEQALALIAHALAIYRELGMESWEENASKLERQLRVGAAPGR
jgi:DNA-binding SARP family transcriptional activator